MSGKERRSRLEVLAGTLADTAMTDSRSRQPRCCTLCGRNAAVVHLWYATAAETWQDCWLCWVCYRISLKVNDREEEAPEDLLIRCGLDPEDRVLRLVATVVMGDTLRTVRVLEQRKGAALQRGDGFQLDIAWGKSVWE